MSGQDGGTAEATKVAEAAGAPAQREANVQIHLRKIPLLAKLGDEDMLRVKADLHVRQYAKRDIVLHKGAPGDSLLFLLSGSLQAVDVTDDGRAIGVRLLQPGDFFGETGVINGAPRPASLVALSPVLVALLPRATALHLFTHSPPVAHHMLRFLAERIQRDAEFRTLLGIQNTARRIYAFLHLMKKKQEGDVQVVEHPPTHQDIASMINTSRETVTRALLLLAQQGVVEKGAQRLIILKPEALRRLAEGQAV